MRNLFKVVSFESKAYLENKIYRGICFLLFIAAIAVFTFPTFMQIWEYGENSKKTNSSNYKEICLISDKEKILQNGEILDRKFPQYKWKFCDDTVYIKKEIDEGRVHAGFIITSSTSFQYIVKNYALFDTLKNEFSELLKENFINNFFTKKDISSSEVEEVLRVTVHSEKVVLGKDSTITYWYTYVLIFFLYFIISWYGQMIATSITTEKSNRSMEILVTSTSTNSLIFGKVFAGAFASVLQILCLICGCIIGYYFNTSAWSGQLHFLVNIPKSVFITYAIFGGMGYLFYCFIYGALGALVSKVEDVGKSIGSIVFVLIIAFFIAIMGLNNAETFIIRAASYIPFTSMFAMVTRVAMGTVKLYEIILSIIILMVSTVLIGILTAKIYRMGTLYYGNRLKIKKFRNKRE